MAKKISDLTEDSTPAPGDYVATVDVSAGASKKVALSNIIPAGTVTPEKLESGAIGHGFLEIARTTLSSAGDTITVSSIPPRQYLCLTFLGIASGGTLDSGFTFNGDTSANYASSFFNHSNVYSSNTSQSSIQVESATTASGMAQFARFDVLNVATAEKLVTGVGNNVATSGAATAPRMYAQIAKWVNTSDQISSITWTNTGTGNFAIGSEIVVYGTD